MIDPIVYDSEVKKVLLVDDDRLVLATFGKGLKDNGYEVLLADSGEKGLIIATQEQSIALAILDMRMSGISGIETAQGLYHLGVPSMFLSAFSEEALVDKAITDGALGYLLKPIDVDSAIPSIEAAISRSKDIKELQDIKQRLKSAIDTSNLVNVVVGILMERHRMGQHDAYELLRQKARKERSKVRLVAQNMLDSWDTFN